MMKAIDYLKKGESSLETLEGAQNTKQIDSQIRFKRSDDNLKLPENFRIGQAVVDGNCFFDSFRKGLEQQLGIQVTVEQLRNYCRDFAQNNPPKWFIDAIAQSHDNSGRVRSETLGFYTSNILNSERWGDPEVEGRILCEKYQVKLHIVEKSSYLLYLKQQVLNNSREFSDNIRLIISNSNSNEELASQLQKDHSEGASSLLVDMTTFDGLDNTHQLISSSGSLSSDNINYDDRYTIHLINRGNAHFEPILSTQEVQYNKQKSSELSDYDDEITPEEELINTIKSGDLEEEKLAKIKRVFEKEPKPDIDFQGKDNDTPLHIAVRKKELKVIEWLVKNGAKIDIKNSRGRTQLEVAQHLERQDIVEVLKSHIRPNLQVSVERPSTQQKRTRTDSKEDKSEDSSHKRPRTSLQAAEESRGRKRTQNEENELGAGQVKKLKTSEGYHASGLKSSLHGTVYQLKLLMLFLKRGLDQGYSFDLATEMDAAEKFDDVVFQYTEGGEEVYRFLQAKHKQDHNKKITVNDLLTEQDGEFSLQKYFISYRKIKQNPEFKGYKLKDFVICTNIDLEESLRNSFEPVEGEDNILRVNSEKSERLKLKVDKFPNEKDLVSRLRKTSELNRLAKRLAKCVLENDPLDLKDNLFRSYHGVLGEKVIDVKNVEQREEKDNKGKKIKKSYAKFHSNFLDGSSQELENFRSAFLKAYQEMSKEQMNVNEFWQKMKARELQISQTFGKVFELDINPQLTNSEVFAKAIANAMSVAEQSVVNIKREKGKGIIKDNINKLAGHVLIKKGDKEKDTYYFSSTFFDDNNKLPGNLESFKNELKAELESKVMEFDKDKYKFHIANFKTCEEEQLHLKTFLPDDYIDEKKEIESFFEKLVFAVNQPNEVELDKIIEAKMGEDKDINLIDSEFVASKFQKDMLDWMKEKKGRFLTHEDGQEFFNEAKQKISKLVLIGPTLEYRTKVKAFGIAFSEDPTELRSFLTSNDKQIFNLISSHNTILGSIKVYQTLKDMPQYQKDDSHIFMRLSSLLRIQGRVIQIFSSKTTSSLLVIECKTTERDTEELYNKLSEIIKSNGNKKVILITQENNALAEKFKDNFSRNNKYEKQKDEKNSLIDLTNKSQEKLLEERKVTFQGKEISLGILINDNSKHLIDEEILSRLINNEKVEIGKAPDDLGDVKYYYIDRVFNRQVKVKDECLKARKIPDLFAISNIEQDELYKLVNKEDHKEKKEQKVRRFVDNDSDKSKPVRFIVLDNENAEKNFKQLSHDYSSHNIHLLKKEGDEFIWQQSYGASLSNLRRYLDDQNKKNIRVGESEFIKLISSDGGNKVVIISAEPGMGKSTVMTNLAKEIKNYTSSRWIIKVNLFDLVKKLNEVDLKKDNAIEFLVNALNLKGNMLSESLFLYCLREQGGVILLLDGFDEISPNYKEKAINLLKALKETQMNRILVSTRGYMQYELEDAFSTLSYTLKPFSLEDQKNFLRKFWQRKLCLNSIDEQKFQKYSDKLLELFSQSISDKKKEFTGVPLLIEMLAENHEREFKDFCDSKKNELPNHLSQEKFDLLTLYEDFIEKKHNRYHLDKLGKRKENPGITEEVKELKEQFMKNHKLFAIQRLFSKDRLELLLTEEERKQVKELVKKIDSGKEKTGIVNKVIGDKPDFIHLSFAEYFAVELISDKLKSTYSTQPIWDFLVNTIFTGDYQNIRRFFDSKLASDPELAKSSSNNGKTIVNLLLAQDSEGPLFVAVRESLVNIIDFLLKSAKEDLGSLIKIINTSGEEGLLLCLAIENGHKEAVEILLKYVKAKNSNRLIEIIIPTNTQHSSPLFLAVSNENDEIIDILLKNIPSNDQIVKIICNAVNDDGTNLVDLAAAEETFSLNSLNKYISRLNSDQQVEIFGDLSNLGFEHFDFIDYLHSVLKKDAFYKICQDNQEEIYKALAQVRDGRISPDQHPEWFKIEALMERQDENEIDNDYYHDSLSTEECLPSTSYNRKKREAKNECLFTWEDIDEFNEEKNEKRDFSKIKIDSEKFVNYIKDLPEEKRSQLIELADKVRVAGNSQSLVSKLISNQKVISHLNRVGRVSGITMHGMMAKNVLADFLNGDYQGVAVNVGFIAGGQGFAKVAEAASLKGLKLASEGKLLLGTSLRAASPFLARGTSAFVVYDLVNQVKAFKNGTEEALVGVVGDSIYLGVDAAEIGIEVAEAFEVLEGVSSVTGPIGAAIGAVVFVGTDVYMAVKRVDKIDELIHLTGKEKFIEGLRAFIGMQPENHIQELLQEKEVSNELVRQGLEYLKQHSDIQSYVFPTGKSVVDSCRRVPYKTSICASGGFGGGCLRASTVTRYSEKCTTKFEVDLDSTVQLDRKRTDIKWSRAKPDNPSGGELFCLPKGNHERVPSYGSYLCKNAIGITDLSTNKTGSYTLINLGEGEDYAKGFIDSANIFVVNSGYKQYQGGSKDDIFILQGNSIRGYLYGEDGINTLDLTGFALKAKNVDVVLDRGDIIYDNHHILKAFGMNRVLGRKGKVDRIFSTCDTQLLDGKGGAENNLDVIVIDNNNCTYKMQMTVRPNTIIFNRALEGNFHYTVPYALGSAKVDFIYTAEALNLNNTFAFEYEPAQIKNVDVRNINVLNKTSHIITFNFSPMSDKEFNITISGASNPSYRLGNNTEIKVGNKGNLYMLENTNKSVNEIIKDYLVVANRLNRMSFFIQSLLSNETVAIGSGNYEVIHNNPLQKSHLVGNGGENVYVIDSESKRFEIPLPEVVIYDLDVESSVDTIDLRNLVRQVRGKLSNQDHFQLKVLKSANDLLLKATIVEVKPTEDSSVSKMRKHEYCTVRLKDGVNWYNKTHVIVDNAPMKINLDNNEWSLKPLPLKFEKDKEVIIVTSQDIEENTELITPKRAGNYSFVSDHGNDLIVTNAFDVNVAKNDLCTIVLSKFYEKPKMATLSIKFADKEIILKEHQEEISTARDVNVMKKEHKDQVYNGVFNHTKSSPEVIMLSDQPVTHRHRHSGHREQTRHRRSTSSGIRPTGWINDLFGWVRSSISGLLSSKPESTPSSISQVDARVDVNGTIMLLDVFIRKVTGQKYVSTVDHSISPLEAQGYALNITNRFEKVLNKTAIKSGISVTNLNFDPVVVQSAIIEKIINGKFSEIAKTLYSFAKEACPEFKQTDKFLDNLKSNLEEVLAKEETMILQQKVEKPYKDLSQEVSRKVQLSKKPDTFLNGTSVVQGISRAIN
ncbi:ankyrin repeat domain-containing protein [Wolbachia endosymbiont (group A) of Epagoge grotiana]|uniref:ankyrin repeat domain-containing protein n=1 Tax=Wolbachia endosymbiont (group A) of Epagoge grotiana TaxID=2954006 RepID=UPI002230CAB6|nr:ankyrin repeat domain-containing protein [Wolbachia endosymbiont (group A) of Epagoge grotiana]